MVWQVNPLVGNDSHDGRSRGTPFESLSVDTATAGDTILIAPGAYDQDLPVLVSAARAANIAVLVAGSE